MDQLWQIALQAESKDVSMTATQYLNNYYINYGGGLLEREDMFIRRCMENLVTTLSRIKEVRAEMLQRGSPHPHPHSLHPSLLLQPSASALPPGRLPQRTVAVTGRAASPKGFLCSAFVVKKMISQCDYPCVIDVPQLFKYRVVTC